MGQETIQAQRIVGGVGSGKTRALARRVATLLEGGTRPEDVLVLCASPTAARAFEARLAQEASGVDTHGVRASTARDVALQVLSDPAAIRWSGRQPRVLTAYEESFLMEDVKVCGLRPGRLKEMLKFFYRSWTELADDDPAWLMKGQEETVHGILKGALALSRSMLEPEVANLAVNYLRTHDGARAMVSAPHVLVDDYQRQCRASQLLANLLARESVTVAGDPGSTVPTFDSYAYDKGLEEFLELHPDATTTRLEGRGLPPARFEELCAADPADEFVRVAQLVADEVEQGTPPDRIVVATPNDTWSHNVATALKQRDVPVRTLPARQPVRGDVRDTARCVPARTLCALDLVADPNNALAWRSWCGFGDHLTNSTAFAALRAYAEENAVSLPQALEAAERGGMRAVGLSRVRLAHMQALDMIEQAQGLEGRALLELLARIAQDDAHADVPAVVERLCLQADGDNGAAAMAARARRNLTDPEVDPRAGVAVVPYDQTAGLAPEVLAVAGFMDGFIPCNDYFDGAAMTIEQQQRTHDRDVVRVRALAGKAGRRLVASGFAAADLETATHLNLRIERIKLVDGVRTCVLSRSELAKELHK